MEDKYHTQQEKRYVKSVMEFADVVPVLIPSSIPSNDLDEIWKIFMVFC